MQEWINELKRFEAGQPLASTLVSILVLLLVLTISHFAVKRILYRVVGVFATHLPEFARLLLYNEALFRRLSKFVPIIIFHQAIVFVPNLPMSLVLFFQKLAVVTALILGFRVITLLLATTNEIYGRYPIARSRPIKGYLQVITIVLYIVIFILCIATLLEKSPLVFLSGLGALTAIIILVFRDTILSFVAGVQLTTNNLIRVGDWIEMPQFSADGDVIDIALNVVRVQNWDRTITVIPTHKFLENSFKNWRGMEETGGRRIKRSFHIDLQTIRFLSDEEIARFSRFVHLTDYLRQKAKELKEHNEKLPAGSDLAVNARRLTNVGTFRAYIACYLRKHPKIRQDMTNIVRQLQPTPEGLPIEIYVFSNDIAWGNYEVIQADIFDHVLAIANEFGLSIYQKPSGHDLRQWLDKPTLVPGK